VGRCQGDFTSGSSIACGLFFPYLGEKVLFWLKSERFPCLKIACTPMSTPTKYYDKKKQRVIYNLLILLVGAARFELATPCAQGRCATRLRYAPIFFLYHEEEIGDKDKITSLIIAGSMENGEKPLYVIRYSFETLFLTADRKKLRPDSFL
jgi:hypothetical protein